MCFRRSTALLFSRLHSLALQQWGHHEDLPRKSFPFWVLLWNKRALWTLMLLFFTSVLSSPSNYTESCFCCPSTFLFHFDQTLQRKYPSEDEVWCLEQGDPIKKLKKNFFLCFWPLSGQLNFVYKKMSWLWMSVREFMDWNEVFFCPDWSLCQPRFSFHLSPHLQNTGTNQQWNTVTYASKQQKELTRGGDVPVHLTPHAKHGPHAVGGWVERGRNAVLAHVLVRLEQDDVDLGREQAPKRHCCTYAHTHT